MWRPKKGWDAIEIATPLKNAEPSGKWVSELDIELVEAGADAMLEGLKQDGIHIFHTDGWRQLNRSGAYAEWSKKLGYLIFIEDDNGKS